MTFGTHSHPPSHSPHPHHYHSPSPSPSPSPSTFNPYIDIKLLGEIAEIEMLMIISMIIQLLLTFIAPLRKRKSSGFLTLFLWVLYLSATSISLSILGSTIPIMYHRTFGDDTQMFLLLTIIASFALLHLGSPISITSMFLEDNELWIRTTYHFFYHTFIIVYLFISYCFVLYRFYKFDTQIWLLLLIAALMLLNGCLRYIERVSALYFASREGIRAYHNREAVLKTLEKKDNNNYLGEDDEIRGNDEFNIVRLAYFLYEKFRYQLADDLLTLSEDLDNRCRLLFLNQSVSIGLRIVEVQLNLIYDTFHTKVILLFRKLAFLRIFTCFLLLLTSAALLYRSEYINCVVILDCPGNKDTIGDILLMIMIPVLFVGAIFLDLVSLIGFFSSDWCIITVMKKLLDENPSKVRRWFLLALQKRLRTRNSTSPRWSEECSSYNLLDYSLSHKCLNIFLNLVSLQQTKDLLINWFYVQTYPITRPCLEFIFQELQKKAKLAFNDRQSIQQVCSARGNLVFEDVSMINFLQTWTINLPFSESLITWHLATDICYWADFSKSSVNSSKVVDYHSLGKQLSDYMAYILLTHPNMVPHLVCNSNLQFKATKKHIVSTYAALSPSPKNIKDFCTKMLQQHVESQAGQSCPLSVLHESCSLAQKLNDLNSENKWEIICKVWIEMLCYAAIRSMPRYNYSRLSKGGELITLVWLYMTQLGFLPSKLSD